MNRKTHPSMLTELTIKPTNKLMIDVTSLCAELTTNYHKGAKLIDIDLVLNLKGNLMPTIEVSFQTVNNVLRRESFSFKDLSVLRDYDKDIKISPDFMKLTREANHTTVIQFSALERVNVQTNNNLMVVRHSKINSDNGYMHSGRSVFELYGPCMLWPNHNDIFDEVGDRVYFHLFRSQLATNAADINTVSTDEPSDNTLPCWHVDTVFKTAETFHTIDVNALTTVSDLANDIVSDLIANKIKFFTRSHILNNYDCSDYGAVSALEELHDEKLIVIVPQKDIKKSLKIHK